MVWPPHVPYDRSELLLVGTPPVATGRITLLAWPMCAGRGVGETRVGRWGVAAWEVGARRAVAGGGVSRGAVG